ncbi:MAG TPA: hypothetical protein VNM72_06880 [Blastocatellia bacterium]|nr:hypothetical protein [Blastocatellia bacterium]
MQTELTAALQRGRDEVTYLTRAFRAYIRPIGHSRALYQIFHEIEFANRRLHRGFDDGLTKIFANFYRDAARQGETVTASFRVSAVATLGMLHSLTFQGLILGSDRVSAEALHDAGVLLHGIDTGRSVRSHSIPLRFTTSLPDVNEKPLDAGRTDTS